MSHIPHFGVEFAIRTHSRIHCRPLDYVTSCRVSWTQRRVMVLFDAEVLVRSGKHCRL